MREKERGRLVEKEGERKREREREREHFRVDLHQGSMLFYNAYLARNASIQLFILSLMGMCGKLER
jgi:hypothetical protein